MQLLSHARVWRALESRQPAKIRMETIGHLSAPAIFVVSPTAFDGYQGIDDEPYQTIAPGVVYTSSAWPGSPTPQLG
jgi:hypothetical protein